jgi:hypothetical protein
MNLLIALALPALIASTTIDLDSRTQSDLDAAINSLLHANAFTHFHADGHCGGHGNHGCDPSSIKTCCTPAGTCEVTVWTKSQCIGEGFHDHADHAKCRGGEGYERPQLYDPAVEFPCAHRDVRADQTYKDPTHDASTYFDAPINEGKKQTVELQSLLAAYKQRKIASALEVGRGAQAVSSTKEGAAAIAKLSSLSEQAKEAVSRLAEQKKSMGIETSHADSVNFIKQSPAHLNALHAALGAEDEDVNALLRGLSPLTREAEKEEAYARPPRKVVSCDVYDGACQASVWTSLGEDWWLPFIDGWAHRWGLQVFDDTGESKENGQDGKTSEKLRKAVDAFDAPSSWVRWKPPMLVHINALLRGKTKKWEAALKIHGSTPGVFSGFSPRKHTGDPGTSKFGKGAVQIHKNWGSDVNKMLGDAFDEYERDVGHVSVADWAHPHKALTPVLKPLARLFSTLAEMHPFDDANSRTRTVVLQACMVRAGGHPLLLPDNGWWIYNVSENPLSLPLYHFLKP